MFGKYLFNFLGQAARSMPTVIPKRVFSKNVPPDDLRLVVTRGDLDKTLDFMTLNYQDDPVVRAMGINDMTDLKTFFKYELINGWTIKLLDRNSDIVGMVLCYTTQPSYTNDIRTFAECNIRDPKTKRLLNLWADIGDSVDLFERFKVRELWEWGFVGTTAEVRGRNLPRFLTNEVRVLGKQGLSLVRGDCTSFFSVKLAYRVKFSTLPPRHVLTFRDEKGCPWLPEAPTHPHGHAVVTYDVLT